MSEDTKRRMDIAVELMRRGGTLLKEPCIKCGGVQVRYKGRTLCVNCGSIESPMELEVPSFSEVVANLKDLIITKIQEVSNQLKVEANVEKQTQLASLLLQYLQIMERIAEKEKPS
ncbi:MAG: Sjogren's syndrome/scleroderma autoantigen 1 family protein [Nitrososphaerota archaeon]|nr:autoantigen p27 domain-containing protein [Nitrososphaerales archaeon]MCX8191369.1 autoantigen p27 domain-containing protein [Nitrososphaerales archaeon]MDW8045431.1 Sjogren's syndrome/scleroderma autoantigen 1 family protein [Nitrososphaerota archaeon]